MATAGTLEVLVEITKYNLRESDGTIEGLANWVVGFVIVGCVTGAVFGAVFADIFGRKITLFSTTICMVGGVINLSSTSSAGYYTTVLIGGLNAGIACTVVPLYISEIADKKIRGSLLMLQMLSIHIGQFMLISVESLIGYEFLNAILIILPLIFLVVFPWFPETPYHLALKKHRQAAASSVSFLRGIDEQLASEEVEAIVINLGEVNVCRQRQCQKVWELFRKRSRKGLIIMLFLIIVQWNGSFFKIRHDLGYALQNIMSISVNNAMIIICASQLVWSGILVSTIDIIGRRFYLLGSMLVSLMIMITSVVLIMDRSYIFFVTNFILHLCHIVIYGVFFVFIGELFPMNLKGIASATVMIFGIITKCLVFGITFAAEELVEHEWYILIPIYLLAFLLVLAFVPETKKRTFLDIQDILASNRPICLK